MGIARTLKTREITFMYKKQHFGRDNKKVYVIIYNKNKLLYMSFATKHNKRIKDQGSLETLRHLNKTLYWLPPHLGEALSSMIRKRKEKRKEEKRRERKRKAHNLLRFIRKTLEVEVLHHS